MSTIATLTSAETGANSLTDINNNFANLNTDKQEKGSGVTGNLIKFGASNVLADTGKTAPTGVIVGTTDSQTLTNKTLTSPVVNTPTGIVKGDVGLGNVDNTSDATKNSATATLTNKAITSREVTTASSATPTPNADTTDIYTVTALATAPTFGAPTGTPLQGQKLVIRVKDNGTARALTFNAIYRASTDLVMPTTTQLSKTLYMGFMYNSTDTKWDLLAKTDGF